MELVPGLGRLLKFQVARMLLHGFFEALDFTAQVFFAEFLILDRKSVV